MKLFLSPHNDDETLFGAFTIQREKPLVAVLFDSYVQAARGNPVTWRQRRQESREAVHLLSGKLPAFLELRDSEPSTPQEIASHIAIAFGEGNFDHVFAPSIEPNGHEQHNAVGRAADILWPGRVTHYLTYTRDKGKSTSDHRVPVESGEWIRRKLRALACYESQIDIERLGCREHFMRDLAEYYE